MATWLAAGSLGWLAPALEKPLSWLALATIVAATISGCRPSRLEGLVLGGAVLIAMAMIATSLPVVNILAVAIVLAASAGSPSFSRNPAVAGTTNAAANVSAPLALAATTLAVFRFTADSSPAVWNFANAIGRFEGLLAGWLTQRPLVIGASFGGVEFLVVMAALTVAWVIATPRPRMARAAWAGLFIVLAQTVYLVLLAFSDDITALLPETLPHDTEVSHLGVWTWGNALHSLLPWNLPILAALLQCLVAIGMFRLTVWQVDGPDREQETNENAGKEKRRDRNFQQVSSLPIAGWTAALGPRYLSLAGLMALSVAALVFSPVAPDLKARRVVAYDDGATDWTTDDPGLVPAGRVPRFGLLPALVESLGGQFVFSRQLSDADLQSADVLIVLPPGTTAADPLRKLPTGFDEQVRERVWNYVSHGGRLIVAGDPQTKPATGESVLNVLLRPTAIRFRDDTANSLTERWEDNIQAAPSAATATSRPGQSWFTRSARLRSTWHGLPDRCWWAAGVGMKWAPIPTGPRH